MTLVGTSPVTGNKIWRWDGGELSPNGMAEYLVFNNGVNGGAQSEDMDFVNGGYYTLYGLLGTVEQQPIGVPGDLNGDNSVDVSDVNIVINVMLGKSTAADCVNTPDLNGDCRVDITDVNAVINKMLGK